MDIKMAQIIIWNGKGQKDKNTMLFDDVKPASQEHLKYVKKTRGDALSTTDRWDAVLIFPFLSFTG